MPTKLWKDLKHKATPEQMEREKREALEELDRMGYAALRKARALTQVEMAGRLDISQGSVASLEARTDLHISTLAKYIRAMGGELEMRAVFPEATFNLEPPAPLDAAFVRAVKAKAVVAKRATQVAGKTEKPRIRRSA